MVEIVQDGKTYVWARRGIPKEGEFYIADTGAFCRWGGGYVIQGSWYDVFALKPLHHTFGGVVFEERERRQVERGEWYLSRSGYVGYWADTDCILSEVRILRPVALEGQP